MKTNKNYLKRKKEDDFWNKNPFKFSKIKKTCSYAFTEFEENPFNCWIIKINDKISISIYFRKKRKEALKNKVKLLK